MGREDEQNEQEDRQREKEEENDLSQSQSIGDLHIFSGRETNCDTRHHSSTKMAGRSILCADLDKLLRRLHHTNRKVH